MVRRLSFWVAMAGVVMMGMQVHAKVYSPWILSEHVADMRDETRFAADPRWRDLTGQEKALAVWRYLTDRETGIWHYSDMYEGANPDWESKLVKDPTKLLNVYGFGVCTMQACMIEGLYEAMGFGVRQMEFGGYHRTAEVEWEGAWHYLDIDERAYLVDEAGRVVSVTEATTRPELWKLSANRVRPFYPQNGGIRGIEELSKHGPPEAHWHWRTLGHSMDFTLRPGESLTRYWKGRGRWRMCEAWNADDTLKTLCEEPVGPKTSAEISANNTYGNGLWVYEPKLSPEYADFEEGVYRRDNVRLDSGGVTLASEGEGWVEWRVRTPYIIAGESKVASAVHYRSNNSEDDTGAAVVEFTAAGSLRLSVSIDQGRHWEEVWASPQVDERQRVDLTRWVAGRYEYHLRFDLSGSAGETRLEELRLTTWTQLAPMSLPRLKAGVNRLRFVCGDKHGWQSEVMAIEPEFSDPADMERWGVKVEGEYQPQERTARAQGPVTMKVDALAGTELRWMHVGAAFNARRESRAGGKLLPHQADRILYAVEAAGPWQLLQEETPPEWNQPRGGGPPAPLHWYYNLEAELVLEEPAASVWLRLEPATAVNGLRVYAHCQPVGPAGEGEVGAEEGAARVVVTHAYRVGGELGTRSFEFDAPRDYQICCDGEPENAYVRVEAPSRRKTAEP